MPRGGDGWRQHVRAELRRRERRERGLRGLVQRHEKLQERMEAQQVQLAEQLLRAGEASSSPLELASLHVQLELEAAELRREGEQLRQQVALLTAVLKEAEAEKQEQRARMGCLSRDLAALTHQYEEAQCKVWLLSQEAEGLRRELEQAQGLLQEAQQARLALEARWVQEKVLEATRVNQANKQEEKYQRRVTSLQEKLRRVRDAAGLGRLVGAERAPTDSCSGTSSEDVDQQAAGKGQAASGPRRQPPAQSDGRRPPGHTGMVAVL